MTDIAIICDHYVQRGGTEHVVDVLADHFNAPVYVGWLDSDIVPDSATTPYTGLFDDNWFGRRAQGRGPLQTVYATWAFQQVPKLAKYEIVIQTGDDVAWYVPPDEQVTVKYVNTPRNAIYDRFQAQTHSPLQYAFKSVYRAAYASTIPYPDALIANSELVSRRIQRYWRRDPAAIIYPPISTDTYHIGEGEGDYYFAFSRLGPSKHIKEICEVFVDREEKLVVGGIGPQRDAVEQLALANANIEYRGYLSETEKREALSNARALVFAAENEDCGMVPIEAFASGTPVIGVHEGFTKYQIEDGVTGILFERRELDAAINRFERENVTASAQEIQDAAKCYDVGKFRERMEVEVFDAYEKATELTNM